MTKKKPDPIQLSKTMAFLLRHKPEVGNLTLDAQGYVEIEALCGAVSRLLRRDVVAVHLVRMVEEAEVQRFEIAEGRIRALDRKNEPRQKNRKPSNVPDILYHATTEATIERYRQATLISAGRRRPVFLSSDESQAWRVAHNLKGKPRMLYVDTTRARRHGVRFRKNRRNALWHATPIPIQDVLNLRPGFAVQLSAGGFPMIDGEDGVPRLALVRVTRRSGVTWEVAKGKLEPGETPEAAAIREVKEEMGLEVGLTIDRYVGLVRYGFMAPGNRPRLKSVYLYTMRPTAEIPADGFHPSEREGIGAVQWFTPDEAVKAVTHTSLQPVVRQLRDMLRR